ncbi:MAG: hypothetical protein GXP38_00360 [Chloroflexi bacterium]|nr:hypothetical protein [Chloroflexota bacterium]
MNWLLDGPPWIEYRTRLDLLGQTEDDPAVKKTCAAMLEHPRMRALIEELGEWPGPILKSHKSAGHLLHKLVFVADLGFRADDAGIANIIRRILAHRAKEGPFQIVVNINPKYGGSGEAQYVWMLCDAPSILYALSKFGLENSPEVRNAIEFLVNLVRENGWPCAVAPELGKFRGPGRKADPCPYTNLLMLKLLAQFPEYHSHRSVQTGVETLLSLWEQRKVRRPYLFAMGSGFTKLKAPLIWYDILHVADVLTQIPGSCEDGRLGEMIDIIREKEDDDGRFKAESVWRDWKEWDFGQKRNPSWEITLIAQRILKRVNVTS